jgi:hypothetical protein
MPSKHPLDADGVRLCVGDSVKSTEDYDKTTHFGTVVKVDEGVVSVEHPASCCPAPPHAADRVWRSAAFLWRKSG